MNPHKADKDKEVPPVQPLGPVAALRTIRKVAADGDLTPAQRLVVVAIVLRADWRTGVAWASYRSLREETGVSMDTIRRALEIADGRYLRVAERGGKGAVAYRIRPTRPPARKARKTRKAAAAKADPPPTADPHAAAEWKRRNAGRGRKPKDTPQRRRGTEQ